MAKFDIEITETLQRVVSVEADTAEEALDKVRWDYRHQAIILDAEDFMEVEFDYF